MQPIVELTDVSFGYGSQPVLEEISLHLHAGQFAALVGPSGAGKTSLLKLLLGTLTPQRGSVRINGQVLNKNDAPQVGYVPQVESVDWSFPVTVEQVVLMGRARRASLWPWPSSREKEKLHTVLTQLAIDHLAERHISDLSGGQQQRVFLARALISEPDLLILDEPTTGLDMSTAENILHLLAHLNHEGLTILMTSHDLNAVAAHLPWVICLNRRVIAEGRAEQVFTPAILNATYQSDMLVMRQDGMLLVQQKPHSHTVHELLPDPVLGHDTAPDGATAAAVPVAETDASNERLTRTLSV